MTNPEFITNRDGNTLLAALQAAIPDAKALYTDRFVPVRF